MDSLGTESNTNWLQATSFELDAGCILVCKCKVEESFNVELRTLFGVIGASKELNYSVCLDEPFTKVLGRDRDQIDLVRPMPWKGGIFEEEDLLQKAARRMTFYLSKEHNIIPIMCTDATSKSVGVLIGLALQHMYNITIEQILAYLDVKKLDSLTESAIDQLRRLVKENEGRKKDKKPYAVDDKPPIEYTYLIDQKALNLLPTLSHLSASSNFSSSGKKLLEMPTPTTETATSVEGPELRSAGSSNDVMQRSLPAVAGDISSSPVMGRKFSAVNLSRRPSLLAIVQTAAADAVVAVSDPNALANFAPHSSTRRDSLSKTLSRHSLLAPLNQSSEFKSPEGADSPVSVIQEQKPFPRRESTGKLIVQVAVDESANALHSVLRRSSSSSAAMIADSFAVFDFSSSSSDRQSSVIEENRSSEDITPSTSSISLPAVSPPGRKLSTRRMSSLRNLRTASDDSSTDSVTPQPLSRKPSAVILGGSKKDLLHAETIACKSMSRTVASRAYDHVYDSVYTVSGSRDFSRLYNLAESGRLERIPNRDNMFSEIPLYPNHSYRAQAKDELPKHIDRKFKSTPSDSSGGQAQNLTHLIEGSNRYRYFRRPNVPFMHPVNPETMVTQQDQEIVLQESAADRRHQGGINDGKRTVGIQTVFRDGEVQTDPYTPDYTVRPGDQPDILTLATLTYNYGLPAGLSQVEMIERAREKQLFEASLPPMTDEANLELRKNMVTQQEMKEWNSRESEIDKLQAERLALLQAAIEQRDKESEFLTEQRVEALRQTKLEEKEAAISQIQRKRIKALRKLSKARKAVEPKPLKRDIITDYAQYDSSVYAPRQISGKYPDMANNLIKMDPPELSNVQGLTTLEKNLPRSLIVDSNVGVPKDTKASSTSRKEKEIASYLDDMDKLLKAKKTSTKQEKPPTPPPAWKRKVEKVVRPPTPNISDSAREAADNFENAVILLQKLIRGRAVQNRMFEGRERRAELIKELRLEEKLVAANSELRELETAEAAKLSQRQTTEAAVDALYGEVIAAMLDFTTKHLIRMQAERKIAALVEKAESERKRREIEEGGRRQAEELVRQREDNIFHQIVETHQATVDSLLENIINDTSEKAASNLAHLEMNVRTTAISPAIDMVESMYASEESIVRNLVGSFLLPEVDRHRVQEQIKLEEKKFSEAARKALSSK